MDRQLKVSLESSVTLVTPEGSKARLLLEKYGIYLPSRHLVGMSLNIRKVLD